MPFKTKQGNLIMDPSPIPRKVAVGAYHAMAWHDDADGVPTHRATNGLGGHPVQPMCFGNLGGNLAIGHRLAEWNLTHYFGNLLAERCEIGDAIQWHKIRLTTREIYI